MQRLIWTVNEKIITRQLIFQIGTYVFISIIYITYTSSLSMLTKNIFISQFFFNVLVVGIGIVAQRIPVSSLFT